MRLLLLLACLAVPVIAADPPPSKFLAALAPLDGGPAAISPDGRHLAFATRENRQVFLYVADVATLHIAFRAPLGKEEFSSWAGGTPYVAPVRVTFLRWADNDRIVVSTTANRFFVIECTARIARPLIDLNGEVRVLDAEHGFLAGQTAIAGRRNGRIIALPPNEPDVVVIGTTASAVGGVSHLVLKINLKTGRTETTFDARLRGRLVYDPSGRVRARHDSGYIPGAYFIADRGDPESWKPLHVLHPAALSPAPPHRAETLFSARSFPHAFDSDGSTLYFASDIGRNSYGIYALDLNTGQRTALALEDPDIDLVWPQEAADHAALVVDRATGRTVGFRVQGAKASTRWLDPDLGQIQEELERRAPTHSVQIIDWDTARQHFVVSIYNRGAPGTFSLYTRATQKIQRILPQRAAGADLPRARTAAWALPLAGGTTLRGWLTTPEKRAASGAPLVVRFQSQPWFRATNAFSPEVFALTQMGFAVLEVNYRGTSGFGLEHFRAGRHRFDAVAAEDVLAAIAALPPTAGVDARRVAVFGEDYGGYLALRAAQLHPQRFVCAVALDPIVALESWLRLEYPDSEYMKLEHETRQWFFGSDKARWREQSLTTAPESITAPVLIVANPSRNSYVGVPTLRRKLPKATHVKITPGARVHGDERAQLWRKLEQFLTQHLPPPAAVQP